MNWLQLLAEATSREQACVLVTVAAVKGSVPREPGATLRVSTDGVRGSVGGGRMEFLAIETARELLRGGEPGLQRLVRYDLVAEREDEGPGTTQRLGQCCGGVVWLHFECFPSRLPEWAEAALAASGRGERGLLVRYTEDGQARHQLLLRDESRWDEPLSESLRMFQGQLDRLLWSDDAQASLIFERSDTGPDRLAAIHHDPSSLVLARRLGVAEFVPVIFGAGHVGRALVPILAPLVSRLIWCDDREHEFPAELPERVEAITGDPLAQIEPAPDHAYFVVMTHSHPLDLALCEAILRRGRFRYLGLIGSRSKTVRFQRELRNRGISDAQLARLTSPIGISGIRDKAPAAIAIAVAAQLLRLREALSGAGGEVD